jgi:hypothetical protein
MQKWLAKKPSQKKDKKKLIFKIKKIKLPKKLDKKNSARQNKNKIQFFESKKN